ncbi:MAG: hypothetical protein JWQ71_1848 [Pedosphaera sp.]|nr:hypothetical protein [Pedosphaera sp.]
MSEFFKKFLLEDARRLGQGTGRQVFLGAFGKHPGWDDHVEDLGLETESLIFAKKLIYVEGIGGQIDAGAWEKLEPAQQVSSFKHVFVWQRSGQLLLGRMWSSSDGKGRTRYPMVVCAHLIGVPLAWALEHVLPGLEKIEQACLLTNSAADVRALLDTARTELRNSLPSIDPGTEQAPVSAEALSKFTSNSGTGGQPEGFFRILYQLQSQVLPFAIGKSTVKADMSGSRPQQIRVPISGTSLSQSVLLWTRFFLLQVDTTTPLLFIIPMEESWLDATMGEPATQELFCLRASPKALPLASEVPYNLDAAFRERAGKFLVTLQNSTDPLSNPDFNEANSAPSSGFTSVTQRWFKGIAGKWKAGGSVFLIAILLVATFLIVSRKPKNSATKPVEQPSLAKTAEPAPKATEDKRPGEQMTQQLAAAAEATRFKAETEAKEKARLEEQARTKQLAEQKAKETAALEVTRLAEEKKEKARLEAEAKAKELAEEKAKAELAARQIAAVKTESIIPVKFVATTEPAKPAEEKPLTTAKAAAATTHRPITNRIGMELVWVERLPGTKEGGYVGKYEVTQDQYAKVMVVNPSSFTGDLRQPVENVSWNNAMDFCRKLTDSEKAALTLGQVYILPTVKQWDFYLADARFDDAVMSRTALRKSPMAVGGAGVANKFGLYDVLGNVWEWCLDETAPDERVLKGGAYKTLKKLYFKPMAETTPMLLPPNAKSDDTGFRCVLVMQP